MTSLTDLDLHHARVILGLTPGRSSATVTTWLTARDQAWLDGIEVVAIDPCAAYARAVREMLPHATVVVDHFHPGAPGQRDGHHRPSPGHVGAA